MIALRELISKSYLQQQQELHARPAGYGGKGAKWASTVLAVKDAYCAGSILDYGCGRGSLSKALLIATGHPCREYDPAVEGKNGPPAFADLVVCTDVLEHIEPDKLDTVLRHLRGLARKAVFIVVSTRPANKTLADGRNAHLIIEPAAWWIDRVTAVGFTVKPPPAIHSLKMPAKAWVAVLEP